MRWERNRFSGRLNNCSHFFIGGEDERVEIYRRGGGGVILESVQIEGSNRVNYVYKKTAELNEWQIKRINWKELFGVCEWTK